MRQQIVQMDPLNEEKVKCETIDSESITEHEQCIASTSTSNTPPPPPPPSLPEGGGDVDEAAKKVEKPTSSKQTRKPKTNKPERNFQCEECGYTCSNIANLNSHVVRIHRDETPYHCRECPKQFKTKQSFKAHMQMTHTDEPTVCDTCGKTFKNPYLMSSHVRTVHKRSDEMRKHKCTYCPFRTFGRVALARHELTHTDTFNHLCTMCEKSFKTALYLLRHVRECHDCIKPNKCKECGKGFLTGDKLRRHSVAHTGFKPYICPYCENSVYKWYKGLEIHAKNHHPNLPIPKEAKMFKDFMSIHGT